MAILETVLKEFAHSFSLNKGAVKALVQFDNMKGALTEPAALKIIEKGGASLSDQQREVLLKEFGDNPRVMAKVKNYEESLAKGDKPRTVQMFKDGMDAMLQVAALAEPLKKVESQVGLEEWVKRRDFGPDFLGYSKGLGSGEKRATIAESIDRIKEVKKDAYVTQAKDSITQQGNVTGVDFKSLRAVKSEYNIDFSSLKKKE